MIKIFRRFFTNLGKDYMETQPQSWREAPEIETVARQLINDHHSHLAIAEIRFYFFTKEILQGDKAVWGRARKVAGLNAVLANHDTTEDKQFFVIECWKFIWDAITEKQRRALVDHELEHCWVDENGKLSLAKHDVEEFTNVIRRHGLWRSDVQLFVDAANGKGQANLFEQEPDDDPQEEDAVQNALPVWTAPRQLSAVASNLLGGGSTAMPGGVAPRQLGDGYDDAVDAEIIEEAEDGNK